MDEDVEAIYRSTFTGATDRRTHILRTADPEDVSNSSVTYEGLAYTDDVRMVDPDANYRRGRFKVGWNSAVDGAEMNGEILNRLTWENLGWPLGKLFGETSEELQERLYEWCVEQQVTSELSISNDRYESDV